MTSFLMASTREAYGKTLLDIGKSNPNVVVLGGDLNKSTFTHLFAQKFPDRFFDFGPAEQNIMSVAAGLAASGKIPFVSTFAVFGMCRPFDQIRLNIAQPHLNVKIVCTHAGIITGEDGMSAHSIEDLALACSLPGFNVVAPSDSLETIQAVRVASETNGPFYIRLYRPAIPVVHDAEYVFSLGKGDLIRKGMGVTVFGIGSMVGSSLIAAQEIAVEGIDCRVINMHTLSPLDEEIIALAAKETGAIVTVEEHYFHGGLGSLVAQVIGKYFPVPLEMVALQGYTESGKPDELIEKYELGIKDIKIAIRNAYTRKLSINTSH